MITFAQAALLNTLSVFFEQRSHLFTRLFGARGWSVHLALALPAWLVAVWKMRAVARGAGRQLPNAARPFGTLLLLVAGGLWCAAFVKLGPSRTGNGDLFGHVDQERISGGVFRLRANPMYDSYVLLLLGLALRTGKAGYLALAGEAIVLLHGIEARVENRPYDTTTRSRL